MCDHTRLKLGTFHWFNHCADESTSLKTSWKTPVQTYIPGGGAVTFDLAASDEVPHAGHPVGQEGKGGHEQGEDHGAVLGVPVQLL